MPGRSSRVQPYAGPMHPGLYLHVPFCAHVCGYCDFAAFAGLDDRIPDYVAALRGELSRVAEAGPGAVAPPEADVAASWPEFGSVFVGGGTPSRLPAADLAGILRHARAVLPMAPDVEVTTEANPEDLSAPYLAELVDAGLTRVSIGAQSWAPRVLEFLDRRHDPEAPLRAVAAAREAGVAVVNLDLIYGAPAETADDWAASLATAVEAGTDHLSAYALTMEPSTAYAARVRQGDQAPPDDDVAADRMAVADAQLAAAGLERYEISNWARPGAQCRHNRNYWAGGDYLGIGTGAHGHWQGRRWWSHRAVGRWIDAARAGSTTSGEELLDDAARRAERLLLGLRMLEGVPRRDVEPLDDAAAARMVAGGLLDDDGSTLRLTPAGRPLANAVTVELLPA
jgi:putative oxygen-independent coproporphyrinogen III oxidase